MSPQVLPVAYGCYPIDLETPRRSMVDAVEALLDHLADRVQLDETMVARGVADTPGIRFLVAETPSGPRVVGGWIRLDPSFLVRGSLAPQEAPLVRDFVVALSTAAWEPHVDLDAEGTAALAVVLDWPVPLSVRSRVAPQPVRFRRGTRHVGGIVRVVPALASVSLVRISVRPGVTRAWYLPMVDEDFGASVDGAHRPPAVRTWLAKARQAAVERLPRHTPVRTPRQHLGGLLMLPDGRLAQHLRTWLDRRLAPPQVLSLPVGMFRHDEPGRVFSRPRVVQPRPPLRVDPMAMLAAGLWVGVMAVASATWWV